MAFLLRAFSSQARDGELPPPNALSGDLPSLPAVSDAGLPSIPAGGDVRASAVGVTVDDDDAPISRSDSGVFDSPGQPTKQRSSSVFGKKKKKRPELTTPRKSTIKASVYEPPNLEVALERMRRKQPHDLKSEEEIGEDGRRTKRLPASIPLDEMMQRFSDGIVFWFIVLRDYLIAFTLLTALSGGLFHLANVANDENGTGWDTLSGLARATYGAVLFWGSNKSKAGEVSDADRDATLAVVALDAVQMLVLCALTVYHFYYKAKVNDEVDVNTITIDDYAVEVRGLPENATEASVKAHFEKHCGAVFEVCLGRDVTRVIKLRKRAMALEANADLLEYMLRRAQRLLGQEIENEPNGPEKWKRLWHLAYDKVKKDLVKRGVLPGLAIDFYALVLEVAKDQSLPMSDRTESAARAAKRAMKKGTVGAAGSSNPDDYNPDLIKEKIKALNVKREENADAVAACAQEGFPVVCAWVTFVEEQTCVDCITRVAESKEALKALSFDLLPKEARPRDARAKMIARGEEDIRLYREAPLMPPQKLRIRTAKPPSDVLWENLHFSEKTMWKRKLRSAAIMTFVLLVSLAVIGAAMAANNSLNPYATCADVGAGGELLDCPAIWDLESTSLANPGARADIAPFIEQDTDVFACKAHVEFGVWVADVSAANGFFVNDANASAAAAFRASASDSTSSWSGGIFPDSNVDECAAHVCHHCYCKEKGFSAYNDDVDGLGAFCKEYWDDQLLSVVYLGIAVAVSTVMNLILKELCNQLAYWEHPQSLTKKELAIASYMIAALVVNMAFLPLFMAAQIDALAAIPFLFKGGHADMSGYWYSDFSNKFAQIVILNALSFPFTLLTPVVIWRLNRWYFTDKVKSQRELNELTTPPPFLLSERYGQFIAQVVYSLIFSAGIPLVHVAMVVFIAMSIVIDRVMLVRYCANPPRYSAKLAALLIHSMPVAVALHFAVAVWAFGTRDAPSYVVSGVSESSSQAWADGMKQTDAQYDIGARIARVNGLIPFIGFVAVSSLFVIAEVTLFIRKKLAARSMDLEGCPPLPLVISQKRLTGMSSYKITANPDYKHLFDADGTDEVSEALR